MKTKDITIISILTAMSVVIGIIESYFTFLGDIIPGLKLGLANVIILFALYKYNFNKALMISIIRVFIVALIRTGFGFNFLFSLGGALLSIIAMSLVKKTKLSIIGVSIVGSISHSIGQVLIGILILNNHNIIYYLPYLLLFSIPTGILSLVLDKFSGYICDKFGIEMILIAIALIVLGIVLYVVDKKSPSEVKYEDMTFKQSFLIGISQALAFIPGVSRSGVTITTARAMGVTREAATKYSFLLSTPIILAAVLVSITDFEFTLAFFMGVLFSFITGLFVIKFLLNYLKKGSFKVFAVYRVILGIIVIAMTFIR